jgi:hypothetical protein
LNLSSGVPAQDVHGILSKNLEEFIAIQEEGFEWDLMYRGKECKGVEFIPHAHFFKCNTEEADRLARKYTSPGINVSQICRYCCCPTTKSDDPRADHEKKTFPMVADGDLDGLRALSQHPTIENVWQPWTPIWGASPERCSWFLPFRDVTCSVAWYFQVRP